MNWETEAINNGEVKLALEPWEGRLTKISNEVYHERPELSSSSLKYMLASPAHFKRLVLERHLLEEREQTKAFSLGSSAHSTFLEQSCDAFVVAPDVDRRTKIGRESYQAFLDLNPDKCILSAEQHAHLLRMFDVISSNELACDFLKGSEVEESFLYLDEPSGLRCKFRPDILNLERGFIADYKTAQGASPHEFAKAAARYHYATSASHYIKGVKRLFGVDIRDYIFIVQEVQEPYAVAIYKMSLSDIERAHEQRASLLKKIKACQDKDHWPDYSERVLPLSIPAYAFEYKEQQ